MTSPDTHTDTPVNKQTSERYDVMRGEVGTRGDNCAEYIQYTFA